MSLLPSPYRYILKKMAYKYFLSILNKFVPLVHKFCNSPSASCQGPKHSFALQCALPLWQTCLRLWFLKGKENISAYICTFLWITKPRKSFLDKECVFTGRGILSRICSHPSQSWYSQKEDGSCIRNIAGSKYYNNLFFLTSGAKSTSSTRGLLGTDLFMSFIIRTLLG